MGDVLEFFGPARSQAKSMINAYSAAQDVCRFAPFLTVFSMRT